MCILAWGSIFEWLLTLMDVFIDMLLEDIMYTECICKGYWCVNILHGIFIQGQHLAITINVTSITGISQGQQLLKVWRLTK